MKSWITLITPHMKNFQKHTSRPFKSAIIFFEDVNLLSNKRRYKLFNYDKGDVYNEFTLIGDFDPEKNGDLNDAVIDVGFYGRGNLNTIERVPIFLGVEGELTEDYEETLRITLLHQMKIQPQIRRNNKRHICFYGNLGVFRG